MFRLHIEIKKKTKEMTIEDICRKIEPVVEESVEMWVFVFETYFIKLPNFLSKVIYNKFIKGKKYEKRK